jgi:hypothetical protein
VAGKYLNIGAALAGEISSFRRRPAMVWLGTGRVSFVVLWAFKPRRWPDLERPESAPARVGFQTAARDFWVDFDLIFLPPRLESI